MKRTGIMALTLAALLIAGVALYAVSSFIDGHNDSSSPETEDDVRLDRDDVQRMTLENVEVASGRSGLDMDRISSAEFDDATREAYMHFALDLFGECTSGASYDENVMISPSSVLMALGMTSAGADGSTLDQMVDTIVPGQDLYSLQAFATDHNNDLNSEEDVTVRSANSVWLNRDNVIPVYGDYLDYVMNDYHAAMSVVPFDPNGVETINSWVSMNTNGMIPSILNDLPLDGYAVLVNAVTFEGSWASSFTDEDIESGTFTDQSGRVQSVQMLSGTNDAYLESDIATGFLKFYEGSRYAFMAILPSDSSVNVNDFAASLTYEDYMSLFDSRTFGYELYTKMPEFTADHDVLMSSILQRMGITDAFNPDLADFGNMTEEHICIDELVHSTHIEVDRAGTRAAAASAVIESVAAEMPSEDMRRWVILDRPFVYAIVDTETGLPVFIGTVNTVN